jgi:hypothetical protein
LVLVMVLLPYHAKAQTAGLGHTLVVFSEDGDKFYLVFDGNKVNKAPAARVEYPGVQAGYGRVKVIFQNEKLPDIGQLVQLEGVEPGWNEVSYIIRKKTKGGKTTYSLKTNNWRQLQPKPATEEKTDPATTGTEPTDPKEVVPNPQEFGVTIPGVSTQVQITNGTGQTNTTDIRINDGTTAQPGGGMPPDNDSPAPAPKPRPKTGCTPPASVEDIQTAISAESFSANKLEVARQYLGANCISTSQIKTLAPLFSFEGDRLTFVKAAYASCTDKNNFWKLNSAFTFSSNKDALAAFLKSQK